jgi:membrane protein DedA with SNARE-associated domain
MMSAGSALIENTDINIANLLQVLVISLIGAFGALLGSYVWYIIGYIGGRPLIERTSKFSGVKWKSIEKFQAKLDKGKSDEITIATLRAIPVMPSVIIATACGVIRVKPTSYTISFLIGGIVRNIVFIVIGWRVGGALTKVAHGFDSAQDIVMVLIALIMLGVLGYLYYKRAKREKAEE